MLTKAVQPRVDMTKVAVRIRELEMTEKAMMGTTRQTLAQTVTILWLIAATLAALKSITWPSRVIAL